MKNMLFELCSANAVIGSNENIFNVVSKYLSDIAQLSTDSNGNIYAELGNKNGSKTILLDAHIDQIGMIVTAVEENGFLRVAKCGGIDTRVLPGSPVTVHGKKDITGIVCCMPPHLSDGKEDTAIPIDSIFIDTGHTTEKACELISLGDVITCHADPKELLNNNVSALSLDNRAGVASLIRTAQLISGKATDYRVVIMLSSQEETYGTGAKTGSYKIDADESIVVDVSFATQPDVSNYPTAGALGKGTMICISPILNREMTDRLFSLAKISRIMYQTEVCSGRTGTNADHISISKNGVKTALLSVPQRYMHTQAEVVSLDDIECTARLIAEYILQGGTGNE
ncbi:MAG: M28 family peptidase [Acutalibacteraceae bacterium]